MTALRKAASRRHEIPPRVWRAAAAGRSEEGTSKRLVPLRAPPSCSRGIRFSGEPQSPQFMNNPRYRHAVPRFTHCPPLQRNVLPDRHMVELLAIVAPSNRQVRSGGGTLSGISPALHGMSRLLHLPSSQRYCVPAWQVADPLAKATPPNSQPRDAVVVVSVHAVCSARQSPSSHLYFSPD